MAQIKRETAIICLINDLLNGDFVRTEGWTPSFFSTPIGDVSRANIMAVIVSKDAEGLYADDGSARILLRSFEQNPFLAVDVGDFVMIIGRPRIYNNQKYLLAEIVKKIDPRWGEYRRVQLAMINREPLNQKKESRVPLPVNEEAHGANQIQKIISFIRDLDSGEGADSGDVIKRVDLPNTEGLLKRLIEEGEVFEIRPGKLKLLE